MSLANQFPSNNNNKKNKKGSNNMTSFKEVSNSTEEAVDVITSVESIVESVTNAPKAKKRSQISVYLEEDVIREFKKFGKANGKGSRSNLINELLRTALDMPEE